MRVRNDGIALMMTLWVLVLLTVIAMSFSFSSRYGTAAVRNFKERLLASGLALSYYEDVVQYLLWDRDAVADFIDEEGNFRTDSEREPITGTHELPDAVVDIAISDEESRLNLNLIRRDILVKLLEHAGMPDDEAGDFPDALEDWKDTGDGDAKHLAGAEDEYYEPLGYMTKDSPLEVAEELLLVKGMETEYFYGGDDIRGLADLVTTWSDGGVNVNTASEEVLSILGLDSLQIDTLVSQRESVQGLRVVPPTLGPLGRTSSTNFRIVVTARVQDSPVGYRVTAVVRRRQTPEGMELRTMYWKEGLESSGV